MNEGSVSLTVTGMAVVSVQGAAGTSTTVTAPRSGEIEPSASGPSLVAPPSTRPPPAPAAPQEALQIPLSVSPSGGAPLLGSEEPQPAIIERIVAIRTVVFIGKVRSRKWRSS